MRPLVPALPPAAAILLAGFLLPAGCARPAFQPPRVVSRVAPRYPPAALARREQGTVLLRLRVGTDGSVQDVRVLQHVRGLDAEAERAARRWIFAPGRQRGQPVECWVLVPMRFRLH